MKEIDSHTARKLISQKTRKLINDEFFHVKENGCNIIVSPFESMQEYNTHLRLFCITEAVSYIAQSYFLPEEILEDYFEFLNWEVVLEKQVLSEECIHNFRDDIDWYYVCKFQDLSEEFISEHLRYLKKECWNVIWQTQSLSEFFIRKHQDKFPEFVCDNTYKKDFKVYWNNKDMYQRMVQKANKIANKATEEQAPVRRRRRAHGFSGFNQPDPRVDGIIRDQVYANPPAPAPKSAASSYWENSNYSPDHIERMKRKAAERFEREGLVASQQRDLMERLSRQLKNKRR